MMREIQRFLDEVVGPEPANLKLLRQALRKRIKPKSATRRRPSRKASARRASLA